MQRLIKDGGIVEDQWWMIVADAADLFNPLPGEKVILPLPSWQQVFPRFEGFEAPPVVLIEGNQDLESMADLIPLAPVIAVHFSTLADGSGYSTGSLLREVYGFEGELRAFGALMIDQVPYLRRCGFNAIELDSDKALEDALQLLINGGLTYQGSVFSPRTPFKFRTAKRGV